MKVVPENRVSIWMVGSRMVVKRDGKEIKEEGPGWRMGKM